MQAAGSEQLCLIWDMSLCSRATFLLRSHARPWGPWAPLGRCYFHCAPWSQWGPNWPIPVWIQMDQFSLQFTNLWTKRTSWDADRSRQPLRRTRCWLASGRIFLELGGGIGGLWYEKNIVYMVEHTHMLVPRLRWEKKWKSSDSISYSTIFNNFTGKMNAKPARSQLDRSQTHISQFFSSDYGDPIINRTVP